MYSALHPQRVLRQCKRERYQGGHSATSATDAARVPGAIVRVAAATARISTARAADKARSAAATAGTTAAVRAGANLGPEATGRVAAHEAARGASAS